MAKNKIVAVYEKNFASQWMLKIYHDGRPGKNANGADPIRSTFFDVPEEFLGETIDFDGIRGAFPPPSEPVE